MLAAADLPHWCAVGAENNWEIYRSLYYTSAQKIKSQLIPICFLIVWVGLRRSLYLT